MKKFVNFFPSFGLEMAILPSRNLLHRVLDELIQLLLGALEVPASDAEVVEVVARPVVLQASLPDIELLLALLHQSNLGPHLVCPLQATVEARVDKIPRRHCPHIHLV